MIGYLQTLLLFYRRHLRVQPLRELMAVGGVAAGVALLFAVQVAHHSITGSFEAIAHGVAGRATLELTSQSPDGFDERVAAEVERMPDVKVSAPIFEQSIVAVGPAGRRALALVGATEQVAPLHGALTEQFERAGESTQRGLLVLTEPTARALGVRPGDDVRILIGERTEHLALGATVPSSKIGAAAESPIAAAPLAVVASLARHAGRITRILIEPVTGRERALREALTARYGATLTARPIDTEAKLLGDAAGPEKQITLLFGVISLVAGVILAYGALLLASEERRRFVMYLIETGTPESMVVASLAFDAFVLGVLGSALGLLCGDAISLTFYRTVPGYIAAAFAVGGQRVISPQAVWIALAGGMLAAFAAAALPALSILRSGAANEPEAAGHAFSLARRTSPSQVLVFAFGLLLAGVSVVASSVWPTSTVAALVGLVTGLVICLPLTARFALRMAQSASQRSSDPSTRLAVAELRGTPARSVAVLATGTIAAFLMVVIGGSVTDVQGAVSRGVSDFLSDAQIWVKPGGPENVYTTQPFASGETQRRVQKLALVSSVLPWRDSFVDLPNRRVWVLGPPPQLRAQIAPSQLEEGSLAIADRRLREGGWAAVSQTIVREQHLHLGQRFTLPTPSGKVTLRMAASIANYGWLSGAVVMNGAEHARLWQGDDTTLLAVSLKPGITADAGRHAVEQALPPGSALHVSTNDELHTEISTVLGSTLSRLKDTTIVVLIVTVAAVIALMLAAVSQRRGRLGSLMSIGMSSTQFARLVFYETGFVLVSGCAIGAVAGIGGQYLIDGWLRQTTGSPVRFAPAWSLVFGTLATAVAISLAASGIAVLRAGGFQARATFATE